MNYSVLSTLLVSFSSLANAQQAPAPLAPEPGQTPYQQLVKLYASGHAPKIAHQANDAKAFSGRCFISTDAAAVKGSSFLITFRTIKDENDPLSNQSKETIVVRSGWDDELVKYDHETVAHLGIDGSPIVDQDAIIDPRTDDLVVGYNTFAQDSVRQNGDWLIEKLDDSALFVKDPVYCYYFIPLK